jgi:hypothetical protein
MGVGRTRRRQHSGKDHHSDRKLELVGHPVPGVRRRKMAIVIDSPAGLARSWLPCVGGPFRCYRNKNLTNRPIADQRWVHPPDNDPRGTCADCPHRPSPLRCRAKVRTAARSHRGRCGSAVRRQDVPGHGHRADHSYRQPQLCAGLPRQSSRDPGAAARRGQPLLSRRMPARWRRGAVGDVLTAQLGFDEFLGERVLVTVDLNTAAGT